MLTSSAHARHKNKDFLLTTQKTTTTTIVMMLTLKIIMKLLMTVINDDDNGIYLAAHEFAMTKTRTRNYLCSCTRSINGKRKTKKWVYSKGNR